MNDGGKRVFEKIDTHGMKNLVEFYLREELDGKELTKSSQLLTVREPSLRQFVRDLKTYGINRNPYATNQLRNAGIKDIDDEVRSANAFNMTDMARMIGAICGLEDDLKTDSKPEAT